MTDGPPPALRGLTAQQVEARRQDAGWNEISRTERASVVRVFLRQFSSFLVLILIAAAIIAFALGERVDTLAIVVVILLNGMLGFVQEWRAERALESLRNMLSPQALVIRDGRERIIPARELVPEDLVIVESGDKVPADANLIEALELQVDESVLTGESLPVSKKVEDSISAGTSVVAGRAIAEVFAIGAQTHFGQIATLTASVGPKQTNLQNQLAGLARQLGIAAILIAVAILSLGLAVGRELVEMFMTGLSLSVAMVPEGLPAVVTITLALGAAAMVRQKALARKLQAVETLGAASVICTDKTGTLTENKMTATRIWTPEQTYEVTGTGYDPAGHIERDGTRVRAVHDPHLSTLLDCGLSCTHARLNRSGTDWDMIGEPTEAALVTLAYKGWADLPEPNAIRAGVPFSSDRKRMSVLAMHRGQQIVYCKGAPEQILEVCTHVQHAEGKQPLTPDTEAEITAAYEAMAAQGLRVIALSYKPAPDGVLEEADLVFLGLVGLIDPPREEVRPAIADTKSAGIRVIMITGDSPITATAIADQLGLPVDTTLTGDALEQLDAAGLQAALANHVLFARTKPAHKMRIVSALQAEHQIVAMTGDGVNDAPALKQADIGVSMGIRGTDVAKDASDLVLLDDNFATIVRAIGEGRRQFANVQKFVRYLLSSNAGEVIALVINILIGGPLIFLATQILWMNLVTDGVTAVALGLERAEPDTMAHPPRRKSTPILGRAGVLTILALGTYTGLSSLWIFFTLVDVDVELARTAAFTAMVVFEKMSVFAFRSLQLPCWRIGYLSNPFLLLALTVTLLAQVAAVYWPPMQVLLHTKPLAPDHWWLIAVFTLPLLIIPELVKSLRHLAKK